MTLSPHERVMGWDVGGAHLKASVLDPAGRLTAVRQEPCSLWRGMSHLHGAMQAILGTSARTVRTAHAVTMSGEMADVFGNRDEGVRALVDAMTQHLGNRHVGYYASGGGWMPASAAKQQPKKAASANWSASATLLARDLDTALLVDMGSTTTDIVPIAGGRVLAQSWQDAERLASGELVYTGVARTPVMALARLAPVDGLKIPLIPELFATTADVYRVLGWLPEEADQHPTADDAAKTKDASRQRLARMVGRDAMDRPVDVWDALAGWLADRQLATIEAAARRVIHAARLPPDAPVVAAGVGDFVVERLAKRLGRQLWPFSTAVGLIGAGAPADSTHWASWCAPAVAVALLYRGDHQR